MFNPIDIHIILIGCQRTQDYRLNLEILRYNYIDYGPLLWITTVFNGDQNKCASGAGENTFIYLPENRGYGYGALDAFNEGLFPYNNPNLNTYICNRHCLCLFLPLSVALGSIPSLLFYI